MAEEQIHFKIGSVFSGEGFKAAQSAIGHANKSVRDGQKAFGALAQALGECSGSVGKAANAVSGLMGAFASGGVTALAFAGTMQLINWAFEDQVKKANEALEAAKRFAQEVQARTSQVLVERVRGVTEEVQGLTREFDRVTNQAAAFAAAMRGLQSSQGGAKILNLEVEKYNAVMAAVTDAEKANVAATFDLKIAKEREAQAIQKSNDDLSAATDARVAAEKRVAVIDEQIAKTRAEIAALEDMRTRAGESRAEFTRKIDELHRMEATLLASRNDQMAKTSLAYAAEEKARVDLANAQQRAALETQKATDNVRLVREQGEKLVKAEQDKLAQTQAEAARKAEEAAIAAKRRELNDQGAALQKQVNEGARAVAEAERAYADALAKYEANYGRNKIEEAIRGFGGQGGRRISAQEMGRVVGDVAGHEVERAIRDGAVRTVRDAERFQREAARAAQQEMLQREKEMKNEQQRYERLSKQSRKAMSKADKDFMDKFEAIRDAAEKQKKEVEQRKQELARARANQEQAAKDIADIKKKLDALGLK